jgi:type II secretory pathway pseudopilin PulG
VRRRLANRRGFALPVVILLVALLTVLLTSGLTRARTERQLAEASDETSEALAVAQSGLQTYFGTVSARPSDGDSSRINVTGGYANLVVHLVRQPADTTRRSLYLVRSTGVVINPDSGAAPRARRTIAQFAEWEAGFMLRRAALTAANGVLRRNGPALIRIWGNDYAGCTPGSVPIPGLRTTTDSGGPIPVVDYQGAPGLIEEGASEGPAIAAQTAINWAGAIGGGLYPDYTSFQNFNFGYPIQRITGDLNRAIASGGSGLLVVTGDLYISGFFFFQGIILVGGTIDFDPASWVVIRGLIVSGLNEQLGMNPQRTEFGNGDYLEIQYASCYVRAALAPLTGLAPVRNAWLDTWASY